METVEARVAAMLQFIDDNPNIIHACAASGSYMMEGAEMPSIQIYVSNEVQGVDVGVLCLLFEEYNFVVSPGAFTIRHIKDDGQDDLLVQVGLVDKTYFDTHKKLFDRAKGNTKKSLEVWAT